MELDLKQARKDSGRTAGWICKYVGVSRTTLRRWERGERTPDAEQVHRYAAALLIPPELLLTAWGAKLEERS